MKKKVTLLIASAALTLCGTSVVLAQGSPPWVIVPADMWACSFNDRQDMGDLDEWVDKFNAWADRQEDDTYAAWTLTPMYYGPNQQFDFLWLGVWTDGNTMGQGWDNWNASNAGLMNEFQSIVSCAAHTNFGSAAYRLPQGTGTPQNAVLAISDCKRNHGVEGAAVDRATRDWVEVLDEAGSKAAIYHWYPIFGGGGEEFDYKEVMAFANYSDLGAHYELMGNGRLYQQSSSLLGHLQDCDSARVYNAQNRRFVDVRAGQQ